MLILAFKIFYDGKFFHGSQRQPNVRTVEGEFIKALESLNIEYEKFTAACRTDKGVHAISQVFSIILTNNNIDVEEIVHNISVKLPSDIILWAFREIHFNFNPRYNAVFRKYIYVERDYELDLNATNKVIRRFLGRHDFTCFSSYLHKGLPGHISSERTIYAFRVFRIGEHVIYEVVADSFLKQMVRRIIAFVKQYVKGLKSEKHLHQALKGQCDSVAIKPVKPNNLILFHVQYPISFKPLKEGISRIKNYWCDKASKVDIYRFLCNNVEFSYDKPYIKLV